MRKVFLLIVLIVFILSNALIAQIKISGKAVTLENRPLEYAEVILFSEKATALVNRLTNDKGEFNIHY